ncbi:MAG: aldehyde dehydrogenase family protein [Chlamydiia bacterium]|nr:aldehyde dehydrogenase family protein [Chlamydiia bacterium]
MKNFFLNKHYSSYVNGSFVKTENPIPHISPADQKSWASLQIASRENVDDALSAIQSAPLLSIDERTKYLNAFITSLKTFRNEIATIITKEMGKVISQALIEVDYAIDYFIICAKQVKSIGMREIKSSKKLEVIDAPIGPCLLMTPWNFPLAMGARKIAPALAAGCPIIARPSSHTPISLLVFAAIAHELNLPAGLLNILIGPAETIIDPLMASPIIRKISFTGSTQVGQSLYSSCGPTLKKASMELGGNAPFIVFEDADLHKSVKGAIAAKFRNNGQSCIAANRFLIHKSLYASFIESFTSNVKQLYIGDPFESKSDLSLVLHPSSREKISKNIKDALDKGAKAILIDEDPAKPQIIANITPDMLLFKEESFGPVASLMPFDTFDEALKLANQTEFGLASYIFSENPRTVQKAIKKLEFGIIGVNDGSPSNAELPFGGIKHSGFGKEGGPNALQDYLITKAVSTCTH